VVGLVREGWRLRGGGGGDSASRYSPMRTIGSAKGSRGHYRSTIQKGEAWQCLGFIAPRQPNRGINRYSLGVSNPGTLCGVHYGFVTIQES